jgi:hypothetical protein
MDDKTTVQLTAGVGSTTLSGTTLVTVNQASACALAGERRPARRA